MTTTTATTAPPPAMAPTPDVLGMEPAAAEAAIEGAGFQFVLGGCWSGTMTAPVNTQSPKAGVMMPPRGVVQICNAPPVTA